MEIINLNQSTNLYTLIANIDDDANVLQFGYDIIHAITLTKINVVMKHICVFQISLCKSEN